MLGYLTVLYRSVNHRQVENILSLQVPERMTFSSYLEFIRNYHKYSKSPSNVKVQGTYALQASCFEVSGVAGAWRECDFNMQQETYPGGRTDCPPPSLDKFLVG